MPDTSQTPTVPPDLTHLDVNALKARVLRESFGFLNTTDLDRLARHPDGRLTLVLVRCGGCRFMTPAQDARHLMSIITAEGSDYVRDVSLPAVSQ